VVNTAYGLGDLDERVRLDGGVAQGAPSSPLLYIFTTAAAQAYSNSVVHGYPLPLLLPVDLGMPRPRIDYRNKQGVRCPYHTLAFHKLRVQATQMIMQ